MKPMLACDWDETKVKFPVIAQPKIDGVRGINFDGVLVGRSLKTHKNRYVTDFFSRTLFAGFDGELFFGYDSVAPDLCRKTTSVLNTIDMIENINWVVFDYITDETYDLPYLKRFETLRKFYTANSAFMKNISIMPSIECASLEQLLEVEAVTTERGFEGLILRDPNGLYKQGRSTVREGGLLRIKRFAEDEAVVVEVTEGNHNENEAQINELGHTFRTSHKEFKVPNGLVGNLICKVKSGELITVSPGKMTEELRRYYFENQSEIIGKIIKYKHFPKGVKDKPRFPTFQSFRMESDL